jgi:hypothetical protein
MQKENNKIMISFAKKHNKNIYFSCNVITHDGEKSLLQHMLPRKLKKKKFLHSTSKNKFHFHTNNIYKLQIYLHSIESKQNLWFSEIDKKLQLGKPESMSCKERYILSPALGRRTHKTTSASFFSKTGAVCA